jgi:thiol:disulfide interchange protein DsbA
MRFLRPALVLAAALTLAACGNSDSPAPATPSATPAPAATTPPPAAPAATTPATPAAAETATPPATGTAADPTAEPPADTNAAPAEAAASTPAPAAVQAPTGPAPREGVDYFPIDPPQPLGSSPGKVEIAEVFSYTCIHCARLDTLLPAWKATLPAQIEFVYVPMAHGGMEQVARGFYAAQALGELDRTHSGMFKAFTEQRRGGSGSAEDIAAIYADLGVDRDTMLATMKSFGVNASVARNLKAVPRWAVENTPTLVVAGKYRVVVTNDRGHQGVLDTAAWLAQRELANAAGTNAPQ